jgi:RNA polymerase sigma factor (sigma-70 family)
VSGDEDVLAHVLETLGPAAERRIRGRLGTLLTQSDYEDALSIALYRLWTQRDRFDPARARLDRWFYILARNAAIDVCRHKRRRSEDSIGDDIERVPAPAERPLAPSRIDRDLAEGLASVSPLDRRIVLSSLSATELGRELNMQPVTIRVRKKRATDRLRAFLIARGHPPQ